MSASPGAAVHSIRSASPRVPTSEYARRKRSAAKFSQAASNSRLCASRSSAGRRRQAGSTFRNVNLTTLRFMARPQIYAALLGVLVLALVPVAPAQAQPAPRAAIVFWPGPQPLVEAARDRAPRPGTGPERLRLHVVDPGLLYARADLPRHERGRAHDHARSTTKRCRPTCDLRRTGACPRGRRSPSGPAPPRRTSSRACLHRPSREAGGHVGYAGPRTSRNREAAVAADRSGRVERVALVRPGAISRAARVAVARTPTSWS